MTAVSHVHKCVFVHIPKCGGTTIERYLRLYASGLDHKDLGLPRIPPFSETVMLVNANPEYFRFAFVRNPYDRFVSYYLHGMRQQLRDGVRFYRNIGECAEFTAGALEYAGFEKFKSSQLGTAPPEEDFVNWVWRHSRRQKDFLLEHNPKRYLGAERADGKPLSFIGRLEKFDEDFLHVQEILRLPRVPALRYNVSKKRGHYSEYYDAAARRRVEEMYAEDLEILGYEYEREGVVRALPPLYDRKKAEQCAPEFSRRERRILFLRALYCRMLWALRVTLLAPLWEALPFRWRSRLLSAILPKTG